MSDRLLKRADVAAATGRAGAVALLAALCAWAGQADAALSQPTAWTQEYANASFPTGNVGTLTIAAGTNRLLLVAITTSASSAGSETLTVSYGGQALTLANGDASGNNQMHTFFYYLKDAGITAATSTNLSVNITSSASPVYTWVYAGVFAGVNQTTPSPTPRTGTTAPPRTPRSDPSPPASR